MDLSDLPFSQVSIRSRSGGNNLVSVKDFLKMSRFERLEVVSENRIEFLDSDRTIPVIEAVRAIHEYESAMKRNSEN